MANSQEKLNQSGEAPSTIAGFEVTYSDLKLVLVVGTAVAYALIYAPAYDILGRSVTVLTVLPVVAAALAYGIRGGLLASLVAVILNGLLSDIFAEGSWQEWLLRGGALSSGSLVLVGVVTGRLRDLQEKINGQLYQLRRVQETLRHTNQTLQALIQSSPLPIFALDRDAKTRMWNPAAEQVFGWTERELIGQLPPFFQGEDLGEISSDLEIALRGDRLESREMRCQRQDGSPIDIGIWTAPLRDASGGTSGMMGVVSDLAERKRAEATMRELAVLEERNRIAREIHDTLAQGFTGVVVQLEALEQALEESPAEVSGHLSRAKSLARESLNEARRSVRALVPGALEQRSLDAVLKDEILRFSTSGPEKASFRLSGKKRDLPSNIQAALLRICQESLANVRRHARATAVTVELSFNHKAAWLSVEDDGVGIDMDAVKATDGVGGFGLIAMEQRARLLKGSLRVTTEEGNGTLVEARIPTS